MTSMTNLFEEAILEYISGVDTTPNLLTGTALPTALYAGLSTSVLSETSTNATVDNMASPYDRLALSWTAWSSSTGLVTNAQLTFQLPAAVTIQAVFLSNGSTKNTGQVLFYKNLSTPITTTVSGETVIIASADLSITLD